MPIQKKKPNFFEEHVLMKQGYNLIIGLDEAGVGALAGPIVAAAVVLRKTTKIKELNDSKKLSRLARERIYSQIIDEARYWAVASVNVEEINAYGIRQANYIAMQRAAEQIPRADFALVDAWTLPSLSIPQKGIVRGDQKVASIAAASILAKVTRDGLMREYAEAYPEYKFDKHKGYGTALHRAQIIAEGPCPIHRTSWGVFDRILAEAG